MRVPAIPAVLPNGGPLVLVICKGVWQSPSPEAPQVYWCQGGGNGLGEVKKMVSHPLLFLKGPISMRADTQGCVSPYRFLTWTPEGGIGNHLYPL